MESPSQVPARRSARADENGNSKTIVNGIGKALGAEHEGNCSSLTDNSRGAKSTSSATKRHGKSDSVQPLPNEKSKEGSTRPTRQNSIGNSPSISPDGDLGKRKHFTRSKNQKPESIEEQNEDTQEMVSSVSSFVRMLA